jgi:transcriptional antiterminator RfaH
MSNWYLVHTKIRQETRALSNLEAQGFECFLPTLRIEKLRKDTLTIAEEVLFPRYLFIRLATDLDSQSWTPIRSTPGVNRLVSFGNAPAKVDSNLIEQIQNRALETSAPQAYFKFGELVQITQGAFAGIDAIYQMKDGDQRVMVLIDLLSQNVRMSVQPSMLRKLS